MPLPPCEIASRVPGRLGDEAEDGQAHAPDARVTYPAGRLPEHSDEEKDADAADPRVKAVSGSRVQNGVARVRLRERGRGIGLD